MALSSLAQTNPLEELKELFEGFSDNIFLRGSLARGEPFSDVDISIFNPGGKMPENRPTKFRGRDVTYGGVPLEELDEFFRTCLRGTSSLMEMVEISCPDITPKEIIKDNKERTLQERLPTYAMFLQIEDQGERKLTSRRTTVDYYTLKRAAGSKRTICRIIWTLKALHPDIRNETNTFSLFEIFSERGYIPQNIRQDAIEVLQMLNSRSFSNSWTKRTSRIASWFDTELTPQLDKNAAPRLGDRYFNAAKKLIDPTAKPEVLSNLMGYAEDGHLPSFQTWTLLYGVAAHTNTNSRDLAHIVSTYQRKLAYPSVIRNVIRNPSATLEVLGNVDTSIDNYAKIFVERTQLKASAHQRLPVA
jgi:predicted nucleotidyltransferase